MAITRKRVVALAPRLTSHHAGDGGISVGASGKPHVRKGS